jgi:hypothetical protein
LNRETKIAIAVAAALVAAWWLLGDNEEGGLLGDTRQLIDAGVDLVLRGQRLTHAPYDTTTGVVPGSPQALADQTPYDLETYALARAISSEEGRANDDTKLAIGWAIKNRADAGGGSIAALVTHANAASHRGYFGTERNIDPAEGGGPHGPSDRYCSTANDPYDGDAQIAYAIQTGTLPDPTGGAQYFDRSALDDNAEKVANNRTAAGLVLADVGGDVSSGLEFWRPE